MQYSGTIYVKFKEREPWEKTVKDFKMTNDGKTACLYDFVTDDGTPQADGMFGNFSKSFEFFSNGAHISAEELSIELSECWDEYNLETLADMFIGAVGSEAVILACSTCLNVDSNVYMIYSVGGEKHTEYKSGGDAEYQDGIEISDIEEWLSECDLSAEEKEFLEQFIEREETNDVEKEITVPTEDEYVWENSYANRKNLESVTIPKKIEVIRSGAFKNCTGLKTVILSEGLESIGDVAFKGCTSLEEIVLPSTLKEIGAKAFEGCTSLKKIDIPDGVETIEYATFRECRNLESVTIPESVSQICDSAFDSCRKLSKIELPEGIEFLGVDFISSTAIKTITVPGNVEGIYERVFGGHELDTVVLEEGIMSINEMAFIGGEINTIAIPESVEYIDESAFMPLPKKIRGVAGSTAEEFAEENGIEFEEV